MKMAIEAIKKTLTPFDPPRAGARLSLDKGEGERINLGDTPRPAVGGCPLPEGAEPPPDSPEANFGMRCMAKRTPGVYILIISLMEAQTIRVGRRHPQLFALGHYLYVGSALGGLESRLRRHLARDKRRYWHIDYLLDAGRVRGVVAIPTQRKIECLVALSLARRFAGIAGFGCSDCSCRSHLFYSPERDWPFLFCQLMDIIKGEVGIYKYQYYEK